MCTTATILPPFGHLAAAFVSHSRIAGAGERGVHPHGAHTPSHLLVHTTVGAQAWWCTVEESATYPAPSGAAHVQAPIPASLAGFLVDA